jgi:hypothetical protein
MLQWPVRVGRPTGFASSVMDLSSPEYATAVGLLLWGMRLGSVGRVPTPPQDSTLKRIMRWIRGFVPLP